jgi:hypothetical protein
VQHDFRVQVEGRSRDLAPLVREEVYRIAGEALSNAFGTPRRSGLKWSDQWQRRHFQSIHNIYCRILAVV